MLKKITDRLPRRLLGVPMILAALGVSAPLGHAVAADTKPAKTKAKAVLAVQDGKASYYGPRLHGRKTASGERLNKNDLVAAHPKWPFGTVVRVTNLNNHRSVDVRVIDRGPAKSAQRKGVVIDLSSGAAQVLDFIKAGKTNVRLEVIKWGHPEKHT